MKGRDFMFDWFKEMKLELGGIDSNAVKKERLEKAELKKLNRFIFSKGMKALIVALAVLYILISVSMIIALKSIGGQVLQIAKYTAMSILAITVIFALVFGKRKGEMVALITSFIFVIGLFISIVLE